MNERTLEHLYLSLRGDLFEIIVDPEKKTTHLRRTSWPEELANEKAKEA